MINQELVKIIDKVTRNISNGWYSKLPEHESELIRGEYLKRLDIDHCTDKSIFLNKIGTEIAAGYSRIVIGDYGAYLEFYESQMKLENIRNRWAGTPTRPVKYIWMQTNDILQTKIYYQKAVVAYADYKPEMYYISPKDLYVDGKRLYRPMNGDLL
ncbi:MAG: hypothetical protein WC523_00455 [Patescibacteria group bacterium]